jgi:hypothetical protein
LFQNLLAAEWIVQDLWVLWSHWYELLLTL